MILDFYSHIRGDITSNEAVANTNVVSMSNPSNDGELTQDWLMHGGEFPPSEEPSHVTPSSTLGKRSRSIPLPASHVSRTQSEIQLCLDQAAAEQRDAVMFYRLVRGIRERQRKQQTMYGRPPAMYYVPQQSEPVQYVQEVLKPFGGPVYVQQDGMHPGLCLVPVNQENDDGGWSISGFESADTSHWPYQTALVGDEDDNSLSEEGIFSLDL
jgi:hypothetical protein